MDPIMQVHENKDEMYELIGKQREAVDGKTVTDIMRSDAFSIERLEAEKLDGKMDFGDSFVLRSYQINKQQYERELRELEKKINTAEGMIAYFEKMIQIEQNDMEMRLIRASVLDRGTAAKRIRAESFARIRSYRQVLLGQYYKLAQKGQQTERWNELTAEYTRDEAAYQKAVAELNVRVLTAASLDRIKTERDDAERTGTEDAAALMQEFLDADYSTRVLEAGYVIKNMNACLHNVELIRRMRRAVFTGDDAAKVTRKLEAVSEYANVVESALWEYGLTIDYEALQIREIGKNDEAFARKRQAYLENGAVRFYLDTIKYKQGGTAGAVADDADQQGEQQTRVEEKLSVLEAKFQVQPVKGVDLHIMRSHTRSVGSSSMAQAGEVIRASKEEAQGKREHLKVKLRLLKIFENMKNKLTEKLGEAAGEFQALQTMIDAYIYANRKPYGDRRGVEEQEAKALRDLESALIRIQKSVMNKSSKYAAILLALLTGEHNGYLEVPPGAIHSVEDRNIVLGDKIEPGKAAEREYRDCTDMPLFTHRPNIKDVAQGGLGDCYLLAGLISVVDQNAEEIMNIMKDNGDGTVTVCFKRETNVGIGSDIRMVYTPCYVTVRKTVPVLQKDGSDVFSKGALWVKMIEKAYAASGLHIIDGINAENARKGIRPVSYRQLQCDIVKGMRKVDYEDIAGGRVGKFVSLLLGKQGNVNLLDKNRADHVGARISSLLPSIYEPGWNPSPARKFGNESVDSIVYEYISKHNVRQAQRFLNLEKPESKDRGDAALMGRYRSERDALLEYRRSCVLHLDIVDAIARDEGVDILKLDTPKKVKRWYKKLKNMFAHYKNRGSSDPLSKEDEIIDGVRKNYGTHDFSNSFSNITVEQFNSTLNILQQRHMALLHRNQQGRRETEAESDVQTHPDYYSARDLKLFGRIEKALQSGAYIAFGTRVLSKNNTGLNRESEADGMVGTHAYTVINLRKVTVNGKERFYVVIMNPWAYKGVVYNVEADGIKEKVVDGIDDEEGVFCLDLKRFAEIVKQWDAVPA